MDDNLGPVIIDRQPDARRGDRLLSFSGVFLVLGLIFFIRKLNGEEDGTILYACWAISVFLAFVALYAFRHHFWIHTDGVRLRTLFANRGMHFGEMSAFSCSAIRFHMNGVYRGTDLILTFYPEGRVNKSKIVYSTRVQDDNDLAPILDAICPAFADRIIKQIREELEAPWTDNLSFVPNGIKFCKSGLIASEIRELEYAQIRGYDIVEGVFSIQENESSKTVIREKTDAKNFYPGLTVFKYLLSSVTEENTDAKSLL